MAVPRPSSSTRTREWGEACCRMVLVSCTQNKTTIKANHAVVSSMWGGGRRAAGWCSSPVHKIKQPIKANHAAVSSMSSLSLPRLGAVLNKRFYVRNGDASPARWPACRDSTNSFHYCNHHSLGVKSSHATSVGLRCYIFIYVKMLIT